MLGGGFKDFLFSHLHWGNDPNLTIIFQLGSNHHLVYPMISHVSPRFLESLLLVPELPPNPQAATDVFPELPGHGIMVCPADDTILVLADGGWRSV